jgi:hypothetical protein
MNKLLFYLKHYGKYVCCVWLYTPFDRRGQWFEVFWHSKDRKTPRKPDRRANNWTTKIMASTYQQSKLWPRSHETALQSVLRTFYDSYGDLTYIIHSCLHIFPSKSVSLSVSVSRHWLTVSYIVIVHVNCNTIFKDMPRSFFWSCKITLFWIALSCKNVHVHQSSVM